MYESVVSFDIETSTARQIIGFLCDLKARVVSQVIPTTA